MKICSNCGEKYNDDDKFCISCGTPLMDYVEPPKEVPKSEKKREKNGPGFFL